jgi:hypothetical protein
LRRGLLQLLHDAFDELAGDRLVVVDLQFSLFDITVGTANHHFLLDFGLLAVLKKRIGPVPMGSSAGQCRMMSSRPNRADPPSTAILK